MASPSMPNSTRINSAIRTIAWPCCRLALRGTSLVGVFSTVDRICSDDDVAANCLLYQWSYRLERVPDRHLDRLVADRGGHVVAAGAQVGGRVAAEAATRAVRRAVAGLAWVGDKDPAGVGGRLGWRANRVAAVRQRAIRA